MVDDGPNGLPPVLLECPCAAMQCDLFGDRTPFPHRVDPYTKKDWYDVKAPATFTVRNIGKTLVTRTQGKSKGCLCAQCLISFPPSSSSFSFPELASDGLKGRVFEVSLADLQNSDRSHRKFRLISEDVQGKQVLTNFHGMTLTTDKLRSLVKKWQVPH